jgi:hypothetical protein
MRNSASGPDSVESRLELLKSWSAEFMARINRVYHLIGGGNRAELGSNREFLFRQFLRKVLPKRFTISTGFIYCFDGKISRQQDVIIWDGFNEMALLEEGEFVVVPLQSVFAIIEVKTRLDPSELGGALEQLHPDFLFHWRFAAPNPLRPAVGQQSPPSIFRGIVALHNDMPDDKQRDPTACFEGLVSFYRKHYPDGHRGKILVQHKENLQWANMINSICTLDGYSVEQVRLDGGAGGAEPGFAAWQTTGEKQSGHSLAWFCLSLLSIMNRWLIDTVERQGKEVRQQHCRPFVVRLGDSASGIVTGASGEPFNQDEIWQATPPLWCPSEL